jgi:hypothetical protein
VPNLLWTTDIKCAATDGHTVKFLVWTRRESTKPLAARTLMRSVQESHSRLILRQEYCGHKGQCSGEGSMAQERFTALVEQS